VSLSKQDIIYDKINNKINSDSNCNKIVLNNKNITEHSFRAKHYQNINSTYFTKTGRKRMYLCLKEQG